LPDFLVRPLRGVLMGIALFFCGAFFLVAIVKPHGIQVRNECDNALILARLQSLGLTLLEARPLPAPFAVRLESIGF